MDHTDTRGLADVDGQLGLLPEMCLACLVGVATSYYILAHVDIARRVERHDGCGCREVLDAWYSLETGNQNERSHRALAGNEGENKRGPRRVFNEGQQYPNVGASVMYRRRLAEHRRDNARPTPQSSPDATTPRFIQALTQLLAFLSRAQDNCDFHNGILLALRLRHWANAYEADHLQIV